MAEIKAKKVKTAEQIKQAARVREAVKLKIKSPVPRGPKRSVTY